MPNRGTQQDQPKKRRPDPTTTPDDDQAQEGDVMRMDEAGNKVQQARPTGAAGDADLEAAETDNDADIDEDAEDAEDEEGDEEGDEPIGGRV